MDTLITTVVNLFGQLPDWVQALSILIGGLVTTATAFTMASPTQLDDKYLPILTKPLNALLRVLNTIAGNVAKNKNADDVE